MPAFAIRFRQGLKLPPTGWALAGMLALYVLAGLFGRDPWKGEDAIHIAVTWNILANNDWLSLELAGRIFNKPPLYYWSAALTGKLLGWWLPLHDAIRLASGLWVALALAALYYAGRELYGQERAAASPLLLAGSAGLILNAHEAQPLLVALAAYCCCLAAITVFTRKPRLAGIYYGLSLAGCLLGAGIAPTLPLLIAGPLSILVLHDDRRAWRACLLGWLIFVLLALPWPLILWWLEPARFHGWLRAEGLQLVGGIAPHEAMADYLSLLPTLAFPTFFVAGWALWSHRRQLRSRPLLLPIAMFGLTLLMLVVAYRPGELPGLLLLPPLALLATPGALNLRRGAASAWNWFAMTAFSFFVALVWVGWSALHLGWPEKLSQRAFALRPGFVAQLDWLALCAALAGTLWWLWLIATTPRSPYRSLLHWSLGFSVFWLLASLLWLPWFDYGRSYRSVAESVARKLPSGFGCLAEKNLGSTQRASFAYFIGVETVPLSRAQKCDWLLVQGSGKPQESEGWQKVWEGGRPGNRRERFHLYRR